jgi:hypothetical protein
VRLEELGQLKKSHLIGTRTRDLPACSIVPQPTTLPRAPGNRDTHGQLHILMAPTYYGPLGKCHVQERWIGGRLLLLHTSSI